MRIVFVFHAISKRYNNNFRSLNYILIEIDQNLENEETFIDYYQHAKQNRSTEGCLILQRSVDMKSQGKIGLNIRTNASPKWDRTRCPEE